MRVRKVFTCVLYVALSLVFIALAVDESHCQTPVNVQTPQQSVMDGMLKACQSLADEVEAGRKLIKAQADEIRAGLEALKTAQQASAEKDVKIGLQEKALAQKQVTLDETGKALEAQKTATTEAVHALNVERTKSGFLKKVAAGAVVLAVIAIYAAGK